MTDQPRPEVVKALLAARAAASDLGNPEAGVIVLVDECAAIFDGSSSPQPATHWRDLARSVQMDDVRRVEPRRFIPRVVRPEDLEDALLRLGPDLPRLTDVDEVAIRDVLGPPVDGRWVTGDNDNSSPTTTDR